MTKQNLDHPKVIVFPPLVLATTVALAIALQWLMPLLFLSNIDRTWRITIGAAIFAVGLSICLIARRALISHGTNVNPLRPTTALATEGIFQLDTQSHLRGRHNGYDWNRARLCA